MWVVHVIYVTWAGVIYLICTHEHEGARVRTYQANHDCTCYICYVTPPGTIKIAQPAWLFSAHLYRRRYNV